MHAAKTLRAACAVLLALSGLLLLPQPAWGAQTLRVAFKDDAPFYQFTDERGYADGLNVDLIEAIAREADFSLEYVAMERLADCLAALSAGEVDVVLGVPTYTEGDFSATMETSVTSLCVMASRDFLAGRSLAELPEYNAVFEYNTANASIISTIRAQYHYVTGSQKDLLEAHLAGRGEVMICDRYCMRYLLREREIEERYTLVQDYVDTTGYAMAVKAGNAALLRTLNNGMMGLRFDGRYEEIRSRWIGQEPDVVPERLRKLLMAASLAAGAVLIAFGVYVTTTSRLRAYLAHQVREKTAELALRVRQLQSEGELRERLIERSPSGMVLFDRENRVTLANASADRLSGALPSPGQSVAALPLFGEIWRRHPDRAPGETVSGQTLRTTGPDGAARILRYSILPVLDGSEEVGGVLNVEDATAEEERQQAAIEREKNTALNRMIAGIAHEIKNPLTGIRNFAELIPDKKEDPRFLEYFSILVPQEVDRISRLIDNLMQYARPPKGRREALNPAVALRECAALARATAKGAAILVQTDLQEGLRILVDRDQLKQVLLNMVMNSLSSMERRQQAQPGQGPLTLELTACRREGQVVLTVADQGEGMDRQTLRYCTDPFFTQSPTGTGLGLAIAKQLAQENGGSLQIESELGAGTRITIAFEELSDEAKDPDH